MSQTAADELQRRLVSFAVKSIELVVHLPKTPAGRHVSRPILRSGASPVPAFALLRRTRLLCKFGLPAEAVAKAGIWLLIILEARMAPTVLVENLIQDNRELACILGASIRTAQAKPSQINKNII